MNIVNESNLGNIKSVFNDSATNSHYYRIIRKSFQDIVKDLEFAKPIIQVNQGIIIWQSVQEGPFQRYTSLSNEVKGNIDQLIKESLSKISVILNEKGDKEFLEDIIEIPSEDSIFCKEGPNGNINIILTEWGFVKDEHTKRDGVLKKIFSASMKSFIIKFISHKNEFLEGVNANITSEDLSLTSTSNKEGLIKINNLKKGNTISIKNIDRNFDDILLKIDSLEEHTIIVNRNFSLTFQIIDSNNNPVSNHNFLFSSDVFINKKIITDLDGNYTIQHPEKEGFFKILSVQNEELLSETLPSENSVYTIIYDPPFLEEDNDEEHVALKELEDPVLLEFLNWRRKPIANKPVDIYGQNGKISYTTDNDGLIHLDSLNQDIEYGVFMNFKNASWKNEFRPTNKSRYTFIVKKKRFLWWWIPFILFFLFMLLIPTKVEHHYTVLDKNTKEPIQLADISSSEISQYSIQGYEDKTDSLGNLSLDYGEHQLFEQIFKSLSTDVFIKKAGYESLNAKVPLRYFKTNESIVYLDKLSVNQEPIEDCNSGGDADNAGGNSIKEFDLKQSQGEFLFAYNTGDTHADLIKIYDCPQNEIYKNKPIWSVDEASGGNKYIAIPFTSRIITVEVKGRGNSQSIWEYLVQCPD